MKKVLNHAFHGTRSAKIRFYLWLMLTGTETGIFWGLLESQQKFPTWQYFAPVVGLIICGYGWHGWYRGAEIEREYLDRWAKMETEMDKYFTELDSHTAHSEQSSSDKT